MSCDCDDDLDVDLGTLATESTDRIRVTVKKDGVAWTGIDSVLFRFRKPDMETEFDRDATLESGAVWYYDTTTTDITTEGEWSLSVKVTDGSVVKWYPGSIVFTAEDRT